jgi:type II secretory pathway component GspD/PulD (secretin)
MKATLPFLLLLGLASCAHQPPSSFQTSKPAEPMRAPSSDETVQTDVINFRDATLRHVLQTYANYSQRTVLVPTNIINMQQRITLYNQTPLIRSQVVEALNAVLALNGISMVNIGDESVKAVPAAKPLCACGDDDRHAPDSQTERSAGERRGT